MIQTLEIEHVIQDEDKKYCITGVMDALTSDHSVFYTAKNIMPDDIYMALISGMPPRYILQEKLPGCDFVRGESGEIILADVDKAQQFREVVESSVQFLDEGDDFVPEVGMPDFYFYTNNTIYYCYNHYQWLLKYQRENAVPDFYLDAPDTLVEPFKQKNILMREYLYKLIKFEEDNEPVDFPTDKNEISLTQVAKQLANYDNWEVIQYIYSDKDKFYEWNAGNAGGIYMYHQGKIFEDWTLWMT